MNTDEQFDSMDQSMKGFESKRPKSGKAQQNADALQRSRAIAETQKSCQILVFLGYLYA